MDKNTVKVHIYGSEYVIKGDADPEHIRAIAEFVDRKMREINQSGSIKSTLKVAILAALNVADEYFRTREDQRRQLESYESQALKLIELVKNHIDSSDLAPEQPAEDPEPTEYTLFSQA